MNRILRAVIISLAASGAAVVVWRLLSNRAEQRGGVRLRRVTAPGVVEELTDEEQQQLLDELGDQL